MKKNKKKTLVMAIDDITMSPMKHYAVSLQKKRLLALVSFIFCFSISFAQTVQTIGGYRTTVESTGGLKADSCFVLPIKDTGVWSYYANYIDSLGMMQIQPNSKEPYFFNGSYWEKIATSNDNNTVATVSSISALEVYNGNANQIIVTDTNRGGMFYKVATAIPDSGTVFKSANGTYWYRIYSGALNVKWFGAVGDSTTDCATAIQAAFDATPNGGIVIFPDNGRYYTSKTLNINRQISLDGLGSRYTYDYITQQFSGSAMLFCNSDTMTLLNINVKGVNINNMAFVNTTLDTASAGYGIAYNSAGTFNMSNCTIFKFWKNVIIKDGFSWVIDNTIFLDPTTYNVHIENPLLTYDAGDNTISNSQFLSYREDTGVAWFSSGGLNLLNDKWHPMLAASGPTSVCVFANIDSPGTSDLQITGGSMEFVADNGIWVQPKTNAGFQNINISHLQIYPIDLMSGSAINIRKVFNVNINGCILEDGHGNTNPAIHLAQVTNGNVGLNTNLWATHIKLDTCTNVDTANGSVTSAAGDVAGTKSGNVLNTTVYSVSPNAGTAAIKKYPNVLSYSNIATSTGAFIIHTNIPRASYSIQDIHVKGGIFGTASIIDFTAHGYANGGVNGNIDGQPGAILAPALTDVGNDGLTKRIGVDSLGMVTISIGDTNTSTQYVYFSVDEIPFLGSVMPTGWFVTRSITTNFNWKDLHTLAAKNVSTITSDGSLNIGGTSTNPIVSINTAHANTYSATQTFPDIIVNKSISVANGTTTQNNISNILAIPSPALKIGTTNAGATGDLLQLYNNIGNQFFFHKDGSSLQTGNDTVGGTLTIGGTVVIPIKDTTITSNVTAKPYYRYYVNSSSLVTIALPATLTQFQSIEVIQLGTGGIELAQNNGQTQHNTISSTTTGTSGYIQMSTQYGNVLERAISSTDMVIVSSQGTLSFN